jgi:uncharacterized damage-inducible protein DinB
VLYAVRTNNIISKRGFMTESKKLVDQLKKIYNGDAWYGSSFREILADISATKAESKPLSSAHSIWDLTLHIVAWESAVLRRTNNDPANLSNEEDWPAVNDTSEAAWAATLESLRSGQNRLLERISTLSDSDMEKTAAGQSYSIQFMLQGVIHHDLYHLGQIALLKRA